MATSPKFIKDASIIPYIKKMDIDFLGQALLPGRRVYPFFDDVAINTYVQWANKIYLTTNTDFNDVRSNSQNSLVTSINSSNSAKVLLSTQDKSSNLTVLYVANVSGIFVSGAKIGSNSSDKINTYIHISGTCRSGTTNSDIILANDAAIMANNYWGTDSSNTIFFVDGTGVRKWGNISGYDNVTRTLSLADTLNFTPSTSTRYTINLPQGGYVVDAGGFVAGTFIIPEDTTQAFKTGERKFVITDSPRNYADEAETYSLTTLYAVGLDVTLAGIRILQRSFDGGGGGGSSDRYGGKDPGESGEGRIEKRDDGPFT